MGGAVIGLLAMAPLLLMGAAIVVALVVDEVGK